MAPTPDKFQVRGFACDAATERAFRAGLAGRAARVQRARLTTALQTLAAEPSPPLVFVDLDRVTKPEEAARKLTAVCALGTAVVAVGSTDTAELARLLLRHRVRDYLVKPISPAAVRDAAAKALDDTSERDYAGRVVTLAGTAGCGVSTLVAAIARRDEDADGTALAVDLDPLAGKVAARLDTEPRGDLAGLLAHLEPGSAAEDGVPAVPDESAELVPLDGFDRIGEVIAPTATAVSLLAYPSTGPAPAAPTPAAVCELLRDLANRARLVMVSGITDPQARAEVMQRSDARVLLYEPTLPSISAAVQCLALVGADYPTLLVQSHPRVPKSALSAAQIRYAFAERRPDVVIPFDPALHAAAARGKRGRSPGTRFRKALRQVIEQAIEGGANTAARR